MSAGGRMVAGWILEERLGSGGFGEVWRVRRQHIDLHRALKLVRVADERAFESWRHEILRLENLSHPNIVRFYDADIVSEGPYRDHAWIATELCDRSLAQQLRRHADGILPEAECEQLVTEMLAALAAAESSGCVHRDIKPANILWHGNGTWKLCDFGTARLLPAGITHPETKVVGTFPYMSPAAHHGHQDHFADLYALGVTVHEALCGRLLHPRPAGMTDSEYLKLVLDTSPTISPTLPRRWQTVIAALIGLDGELGAQRLGAWFAETRGLAPPAAALRTTPSASAVHATPPPPLIDSPSSIGDAIQVAVADAAPTRATEVRQPTVASPTGRTEVREPTVAAPTGRTEVREPTVVAPTRRGPVRQPTSVRPAPQARPAPPVYYPPVGPPAWAPLRPDPTSVIGRRMAAFVIDALILVPVSALFWYRAVVDQYKVVPRSELGDAEDPCAVLGDAYDDCVDLFGTVYVSDSDPWGATVALLMPSLVVCVALEGLTGVTVGKLVAGLRTVRANGRRPGLVRAFVRWLLWIVDGIPCVFPLVGLIAVSHTRGHRRLGDLAAGTSVVRRAYVGMPVVSH